jgi:polyhydroxybutyrate depolymerase
LRHAGAVRALVVSVAVAVAGCSTGSQRLERAALPEQGRTGVVSGRSEHLSSSGGVQRRWVSYLPRAAASAAPPGLPLVFDLHGSGGTPEDQLELSGLEALADSEGFAIVAPEGIDHMWNVPVDPAKPSDVRFVSELIDELSALTPIDRQRVFATGFSGGGRMVSQLACDLSGRIAAIAAVGGIRFPGPCSEARAVPILAFHGSADQTNPYDGGGRPYWGTGVEYAVSGWAGHNRCAQRAERALGASALEIRHGGESCGAEVVLVRIEGFGHSWPDRIGAPLTGSGEASGEITADQALWAFFQRHPLPAPSAR